MQPREGAAIGANLEKGCAVASRPGAHTLQPATRSVPRRRPAGGGARKQGQLGADRGLEFPEWHTCGARFRTPGEGGRGFRPGGQTALSSPSSRSIDLSSLSELDPGAIRNPAQEGFFFGLWAREGPPGPGSAFMESIGHLGGHSSAGSEFSTRESKTPSICSCWQAHLQIEKWSGRKDLNLRPLPPEGSALPS